MNKENLHQLFMDMDKVRGFFNDYNKSILWFTTKNPHLGEVEPVTLYERDRGHKVTSFIESKLKGE